MCSIPSPCQQFFNCGLQKINKAPSVRVTVICSVHKHFIAGLWKRYWSCINIAWVYWVRKIIMGHVRGSAQGKKCHPSLCPSPQTCPSVLKLENWNFAFTLLSLFAKKLPSRFLNICLKAETWEFFFKAWQSWPTLNSVSKISAVLHLNWGRIWRRWQMVRGMNARNTKIYPICKKFFALELTTNWNEVKRITWTIRKALLSHQQFHIGYCITMSILLFFYPIYCSFLSLIAFLNVKYLRI